MMVVMIVLLPIPSQNITISYFNSNRYLPSAIPIPIAISIYMSISIPIYSLLLVLFLVVILLVVVLPIYPSSRPVKGMPIHAYPFC